MPAHDDPDWGIREIALAVRRWIERPDVRTAPAAEAGCSCSTTKAVRYGLFDDVSIVGVVDARVARASRGGTSSTRRRCSNRSAGPRRRIGAPRLTPGSSTCWGPRRVVRNCSRSRSKTMRIVSRSMQLDEVPRACLTTIQRAPGRRYACLRRRRTVPRTGEPSIGSKGRRGRGLLCGPRDPLRSRRNITGSLATGGGAPSPLPARAWSVSALETYLDCPFSSSPSMSSSFRREPDERGSDGPAAPGTIRPRSLRAVLRLVAEGGTPRRDARQPRPGAADVHGRRRSRARAAARGRSRPGTHAPAWLVGGGWPWRSGLPHGSRASHSRRRTAARKRLEGEFTIATATVPRVVSLRGKADRVDCSRTGRSGSSTTSWAGRRIARARLQLPIYSICAEQRLASHRGRNWTLGEAAYLAFKGPRRVVPLFASAMDRAKVARRRPAAPGRDP